jgi:hypothetical protein
MVVEEVAKKGRNFTGLGAREFFVELRANHALVAFVAQLSVGIVAAIIVRASPKLADAGVLYESERQVFVVIEVIQELVVRVTERSISRILEGSHEDRLQNGFNGEGTYVSHGAVEFCDRVEMTVDITLGVSVPSHHAGDFAGKQNSLHALVIKREIGEKGFPYLLGTQLPGGAVGVENFHNVCEWVPEILKEAIYGGEFAFAIVRGPAG